MGWKKWPGWKKGLSIGVIIPVISCIPYILILFISILIIPDVTLPKFLVNLIHWTMFLGFPINTIISRFVCSINYNFCGIGGLVFAPLMLLDFVFYGLIGSILGWIYDKIKKK